jgi:glycosyltransferase involved in cell wall biosynthesis
MEKKDQDLSWCIAIPAYNEEKSIEKIVRDAFDFLTTYTSTYSVLVLDDGSQDQTGKILDKLADEFPRLRVIHRRQNRGIGPSWVDLYKNADADLVATCPADRQFDPHDFEIFLPFVDDFDIITCYRDRSDDRLFRRLITRLNRILNYLLFGIQIRDINWVKVYKRWVLEEIDFLHQTTAIETEIVVKALRRGARVKQVFAPYHPRRTGQSTPVNSRYIWDIYLDLIKLAWESKRGE